MLSLAHFHSFCVFRALSGTRTLLNTRFGTLRMRQAQHSFQALRTRHLAFSRFLALYAFTGSLLFFLHLSHFLEHSGACARCETHGLARSSSVKRIARFKRSAHSILLFLSRFLVLYALIGSLLFFL